MTCGLCSFTDTLCYCSMPPQVKCTITNEFHCYDDECNCEEAMTSRKAELEHIKDRLSDSIPLAVVNSLNTPSISFSGENTAVSDIHFDSVNTATSWGATPCLVCGEDVQLEGWWIGGPKICPSCQKAIKFIKEKFSKELEEYEIGEKG